MMRRANTGIIDIAYFFWILVGLAISHDRLLFFIIILMGLFSYIFIKKAGNDEKEIRKVIIADAVVSAIILTMICLRNLAGI
jgi:hypothetical protein